MKKYRSYKGDAGKIAPNLLKREFNTTAPNQKWDTDVTKFSLFGQKMYFLPTLDLRSSDLINYVISERPVLSRVMDIVSRALPVLLPGNSTHSALRSGLHKHY